VVSWVEARSPCSAVVPCKRALRMFYLFCARSVTRMQKVSQTAAVTSEAKKRSLSFLSWVGIVLRGYFFSTKVHQSGIPEFGNMCAHGKGGFRLQTPGQRPGGPKAISYQYQSSPRF
jgi:hypothetical protein